MDSDAGKIAAASVIENVRQLDRRDTPLAAESNHHRKGFRHWPLLRDAARSGADDYFDSAGYCFQRQHSAELLTDFHHQSTHHARDLFRRLQAGGMDLGHRAARCRI